MIIYEDGRNVSRRTPEEEEKFLRSSLAGLSPEEREVVELMLEEMKGGKSTLIELMSELEYLEPVVDIETWLKEPYYFGKAHNLWPKLVDDMIELFEGDYHEVILRESGLKKIKRHENRKTLHRQ